MSIGSKLTDPVNTTADSPASVLDSQGSGSRVWACLCVYSQLFLSFLMAHLIDHTLAVSSTVAVSPVVLWGVCLLSFKQMQKSLFLTSFSHHSTCHTGFMCFGNFTKNNWVSKLLMFILKFMCDIMHACINKYMYIFASWEWKCVSQTVCVKFSLAARSYRAVQTLSSLCCLCAD